MIISLCIHKQAILKILEILERALSVMFYDFLNGIYSIVNPKQSISQVSTVKICGFFKRPRLRFHLHDSSQVWFLDKSISLTHTVFINKENTKQ